MTGVVMAMDAPRPSTNSAVAVTPTPTPAPQPAPAPAPTPAPPATKPPTTAQLIQQLRSSDSNVVLAALDALSDWDAAPSAVVPELTALIKTHTDDNMRMAGINVAEYYDNAYRFIPAFEACLVHPNADLRDAAISAIADIEHKEAIDALIRALGNQHEDVRESAQDALEFFTDQEFTTQQQWQDWWKSNRARFSFDD
jgi:HEAT repeat protein